MQTSYSITQTIIERLSAKEETISVAESCTGGRIVASITSFSGSSKVLHGSMVTYSNEIKTAWLGVPKEILQTKGAVSQECVEAMLIGMQKMAHSHYTLAVSGIAGPTGGTSLKPVGTVYIGILLPNKESEIHHCFFDGDRNSIQEQATLFALTLLLGKIK